jgi:tetratricopeptide (TPR) repeat protein
MQLKVGNPEEDFSGYEEFQHNLFERFRLKKEEKKILMYLSIMPVQGIPEKLFYILADISDSSIGHLKECMLVNRQWNENWQDEMLSLHPVIAEAARKVFRPSCQNCGSFITNLSNYLSGKTNGVNSWMRTYEENQRLEPYIFAAIQAFEKPAPWLLFPLEEIVTFLWIQCYFKESEQYALRLYHAVEAYYGEEHPGTGFMAYRISAIYYNGLDFEKSLSWSQKGYEILKKCRPLEEKYELYYSNVMERLAKLYRYNGKVEEALEVLESAIEEARLIGKRGGSKDTYFYCLLLKCKILLQIGKLDEAEEIYEQEIMGKGPDDIREGFRANEFRCFYVDLLVVRGKLEQAYQTASAVVECALLYRGDRFKDTLSCMEQLADICASMEKNSEAHRLYKRIVEQLEEYYPYQGEWRDRILDKLLRTL